MQIYTKKCCTVEHNRIDGSKSQSMFRSLNEVVAKPFKVRHTGIGLK